MDPYRVWNTRQVESKNRSRRVLFQTAALAQETVRDAWRFVWLLVVKTWTAVCMIMAMGLNLDRVN